MIPGGGGGIPSAGPIPKAAEWKFSQVFGERMAGEEVQDGKIVACFLGQVQA